MKKYVSPDVTLLILECQDVCTASGVGENNSYESNDYDFGGAWL